MWLAAPEGGTPVNLTSASDWQIAERRDNVISITLQSSQNYRSRHIHKDKPATRDAQHNINSHQD